MDTVGSIFRESTVGSQARVDRGRGILQGWEALVGDSPGKKEQVYGDSEGKRRMEEVGLWVKVRG